MTASDQRIEAVNTLYGRNDLAEVILEELRAAGVDPEQATPADLAALDQFHGGGKGATLGLLELAQLPRRSRILDVGGGFGGPARTVAEQLDAHVTVLDLTEEFIRVGQILTGLTGLSDRVDFQHGDALDMPFLDGSFDVVWMQNATMNLPDKPRLFREIHRVLRPRGRLAMQDLLAGPVQPLHFPVMWAHDASLSFLRTEAETRAMMAEAGLREIVWQRVTEAALSGHVYPASRAGLLVRATEASQITENGKRNTAEGRVIAVWVVADRD